MNRDEFIELAGGVLTSDKRYSNWGGAEKYENFWAFFFDTERGWVQSAYGAIPVSTLHQKQKHSIEHIIPKSFLRGYLRNRVERDVRYGATVNPFNFLPAERNLNSGRSNHPFDWDGDRVVRPFKIPLNPDEYGRTGLDDDTEWVIPRRSRGDIARAILYMCMVYDIAELYNRHIDQLIHWAKVDTATSWEMAFNRWMKERTGFSNPFIGDPEDVLPLLNDEGLRESIRLSGV